MAVALRDGWNLGRKVSRRAIGKLRSELAFPVRTHQNTQGPSRPVTKVAPPGGKTDSVAMDHYIATMPIADPHVGSGNIMIGTDMFPQISTPIDMPKAVPVLNPIEMDPLATAPLPDVLTNEVAAKGKVLDNDITAMVKAEACAAAKTSNKTMSHIRAHKLKYENMIQEGDFSATFSGTYRGNPCAIVTLKKKVLERATPELFTMFRSKVSLMEQMSHRNIVRMLGYQDVPRPIVILQRTEKGNLFEILKAVRVKDNGYTFKRGLTIMLDIVAALRFLHSRDFVHMNFKSKSCYVDQDWKGKLGGLGRSLDLMSRINENFRKEKASGGE